jgi:chromate transporter
MAELWRLFVAFLKIGATGFGGGYSMLSLIMTESRRFSISAQQIADLSALDMVVPGPIAINAATYVGYLGAGVWGAVAATLGVMLPSFILIGLIARFLKRYRQNNIMEGFLSGIKPAAVGLIAAAAAIIALEVVAPGAGLGGVLASPAEAIDFLLLGIFAATAFLSVRFRVNPILLTVAAGVLGALFVR